jgi:hypothetical protein
MSSTTKSAPFSLEQLKQAIALKEQIASLEQQIAAVLGGAVATPAPAAASTVTAAPPVRRGRGGPRVMSPAARARIAAAQKARWAKFHAAQGAKPAPAAKKAGGISPEGRARIIAAQKARWAKYRKQQG